MLLLSKINLYNWANNNYLWYNPSFKAGVTKRNPIMDFSPYTYIGQ